VIRLFSYTPGRDLSQLTDQVEAVSSSYARTHGIARDDTWFLLSRREGELGQ
jgi:hypothetical protein